MAAKKTQKTQLYVVSGATAATAIDQVASIDGLGGARDQIDTTHLMSDEREFEGGFNTPGPITVNIIWDEALASHALLNTLRASGAKVEWMIADSDGTAAPTVAASAFAALTTRTNRKFIGYVADITLSFAPGEVQRAVVTIQRSGPVTTTVKA